MTRTCPTPSHPGLTACTLGRALGPGRVVPGVWRQCISGDGCIEAVAEDRQLSPGQHLGLYVGIKWKSSSRPHKDANVLLHLAPSPAVTMTMRDALMGPRASRLWV